MSTPSLLNIPYLYKAGTLYSQIPESGAGDFTVSRTTSVANRSTRINKDGFIETVLDNVPRLDYPVGGAVNGCPALLVEPTATNLFQRSEEFNNAYWTPSNVTPTPNSTGTLDPFGGNNAELVTKTSGINTVARIARNAPFLATGTHTLSVFAKASVGDSFGLRLDANGNTANTSFTFSTKTLLNSGANVISSSFQEFPNGWFRVSLTANVLSTGWLVDTILLFTNPTNDAFWIFGAQLEASSVPTSYIPTTTAAVTRSEDRITKTGITSLIGQTEGTFYFEGEAEFAGSDLPMINRSIQNSVLITKNTANRLVGYVYYNGVFIAWTTPAPVIGPFKAAVAYKQGSPGDSAFFVNGVQVSTTNTTNWAFTGALNDLIVRSDGWSSGTKPYKVRGLGVYPNRIPNTAAPGVLSLATLTAL